MKSYLLLVLLAISTVVKGQSEYAITVESRNPSGIIDEKLYGQLLTWYCIRQPVTNSRLR